MTLPTSQTSESRPTVYFGLIALIFFIKFATYAWLVTPLWAIPDETGHYSYIENIIEGQLPILGEAKIAQDVERSWRGNPAIVEDNWIAQHPPLFYALDAIPVMLARAANFTFAQQVRTARILPALFGALTILGLAMFLWLCTGRAELSLAGSILFAATPMFTHISTGVSHDTLVACTVAWSAYWCARWLQSRIFHYSLYCGFLVAAGTITKLTVLAMAVPLFFAMAWYLWQDQRANNVPWHKRWNAAKLWLTMFLPVCLWMARNFYIYGQPLPDASIIYTWRLESIGFLQYMMDFPVWQKLLFHFVALIGWAAGEGGQPRLLGATGPIAHYYFCIFFALGCHVFASDTTPKIRPRLRWTVPSIIIVVALACWVLLSVMSLATLTVAVLALALFYTFIKHFRAMLSNSPMPWLLATSALCTIFFSFIYYEHVWSIFDGRMRAEHGRYFYAILPFFMLVLLEPLRARTGERLLLLIALGAMLLSDYFYLHHIFRFFGQI